MAGCGLSEDAAASSCSSFCNLAASWEAPFIHQALSSAELPTKECSILFNNAQVGENGKMSMKFYTDIIRRKGLDVTSGKLNVERRK